MNEWDAIVEEHREEFTKRKQIHDDAVRLVRDGGGNKAFLFEFLANVDRIIEIITISYEYHIKRRDYFLERDKKRLQD